ncbi:Long-chain-fatty-acid--CoA ligase FadD13 [Pseudidiomarina piscicola]|uniref:Long-chain-fatty-acid--CoA ligase FadD13 n=1 Tax=Pseudidiomarina piscicola TaxID=2614830 RepID=A0A6S6WP02_9GAMM|nr:AMP-binding protein [Pseudidiomarina piscicola]CAB0150625.1 Long-chain-fatty-acid--CoA ligase FadD13 [Pseudidiomarina piscicola]VZT40127.1 Long-chain-fatty-acid--CoA ligase FadD13 [Pseudomonas aeruginosa]
MTIYQMLARNWRKYPQQLALTDDQQQLSWQQLGQRVEQLAAWLYHEHDVRNGDRVALVLPNSIEFVVGVLAIQRLDAIAVPINVRLTTPEFKFILGDSESTLVLTSSLTSKAIEPLVAQGLVGLWLDRLDPPTVKAAEVPPAPVADRLSPAILLYTSGTTGRPKGVLYNQSALHAVAMMMALEMSMSPQSKLLHLMPFTHSAPLNLFLFAGLLVGAAHVVAPTFTPDLLLTLVPKHQVTHFFGAPVAYLLTAQHAAIESTDLSTVTHWVYGGAAMSTGQTQQVQKAFNSNQFYCVYGLTEAGPSGTLLLPAEHATKAGSVGQRAAFNTEVRLRTDNGRQPAVGEPGEVEIFGEGMMACYWNNPAATQATLTADGWLKTGDVAIQDEDGFYWIKDRKKDIIIAGGVNIYPREIEDTLSAHPAVVEVAVIGVPHAEWGETVKAVIVAKEAQQTLEPQLKEFLAARLADFKLPRLYQWIDELPRNANGKVLKHQLR